MRIEKCYIENFGKLSDFSYEFAPKINVIKEKNGFGKSTLCAFIKVMFYGLQGVRVKNLYENERKMFMPWQGGNFGGYLDFSQKDKRYRIERKFGATAKADKFLLIDLVSGEESNDYSENIGEELFGIDVNGFEKCTYYTSLSAEKSVPSSILAKLFDNSDNINAYENAVKRLEKREKYYQTARNTGVIPILKSKLLSLQNSLFEVENRTKNADELKKQLGLLSEQKKDLENQLEFVRKQISNNAKTDAEIAVVKEKIKYYNSLIQKKNQAKEELDSISKKYKNGLPSEKKISEISALFEKYKQFSLVENKPKRFVLPIVLAVLSVFFLLLSFIVNFNFAVLISVFAVLALSSAGAFVAAFSKNKIIKQFLQESENLKNSVKHEFSEILVSPDDDFDDNLKTLNKDFYEYQNKKRAYEDYLNQAKEYYNSENLNSYKDGVKKNSSLDLNSKEKDINKRIDEISYNSLSLKNELESISEFEEKIPEIVCNIEKTNKELETAKENLQAIVIAKELIFESNDNLTLKYKEKINDNFVNNLNLVFDNCEAVLSNSFDVKISEAGEFREIKSFSAGQKTGIELALRLSIIDSIFENEKPFIILDDTFNNLDDDAFKSVSQRINNLSENIQIIYFTCSKSRVF